MTIKMLRFIGAVLFFASLKATAADFFDETILGYAPGKGPYLTTPFCACVTEPCNCTPIPNPNFNPSAIPDVSCIVATGATANATNSNTDQILSYFGRTTCNYVVPNLDPPKRIGDTSVTIQMSSRATLAYCPANSASCNTVATSRTFSDNDYAANDEWMVSGGNYRRSLLAAGTYKVGNLTQLQLPRGWTWIAKGASCSAVAGLNPFQDSNTMVCNQTTPPFAASNGGCPRRSPDNGSGTVNADGTCPY